MTSYAPTPEKPSRVRVRWDNVMIVLVVMAIVAFAGVAFILINAGRATDAPRPEGADTSPTTAVADEATADAGALDLDDARGLVDDARALMTEARWDEAAEHLALVPVDMRDQMDVASVEQELAEARELHEGLRAQVTAMVEARRWVDARAALTQLEDMAPLDQELLDMRATVLAALAASDAPSPTTPKADTSTARPAPAPKQPASGGGNATGGGGPAPASSGSRPATSPATPATAPKPSTAKPKPAAAPVATTPAPAGGAQPAADQTMPSSHDDMPGDLDLTPAQQAAIEAALADAGL